MVADRRVVVTGRIAGETRDTAEAKLRAAGAIVQPKITKDTDLLIAGDGVGQTKINAAAKHGVQVVSWYDAFRNSGENSTAEAGASATTYQPRAPIPNARQWGPMLCKPGDLLTGDGWLYEVKWDGIRGIVTVKNGQVAIQSRSGLSDLTNRYPNVTEELALLPDCVLDGELVQMGDELGLLPDDCDPDPVARFLAWDILEHDGDDVTSLPLTQRRELLGLRVPGGCYVACSPVFTDGQKLLDFVTEHNLEGVVAKREHSRYLEGNKGGDWVKTKVRLQQEFIVLGYTPGEGARAATFGSLILGYWDGGPDGGDIAYGGRVGTGWDDDDLKMLLGKMTPLVTQTGDNGAADDYYESSRFPKELLREAVWLKPELVVEVAFQKWTGDQVIYHSSWVRVRDDKGAWEVVRET